MVANPADNVLLHSCSTDAEDTTLVIGGGIAGLAAAYALVRKGKRVILAEKDDRYGGQVYTIECPGLDADYTVTLEQGPEGFIGTSVHIPQIATELGIEEDIICQAVRENMTFEDGKLQTLPEGESARRLGLQVEKRQMGVGLRSFRKGLGQLVAALVAHLERSSLATLLLNCEIESLVDNGTTLLATEKASKTFVCQSVILACPVHVMCRILSDVLEEHAKTVMEQRRAHDNININLVYATSDALLDIIPNSTGFSVPQKEQEARCGLRAVSFVHKKFPELAGPFAVMRAHFRPVGDAGDVSRFVAEARRTLAEAMPGFETEPAQACIRQWNDVLVERTPELLEAIQRAQEKLLEVYGGKVHLAGSSLGRIGIDSTVTSSIEAVDRMVALHS